MQGIRKVGGQGSRSLQMKRSEFDLRPSASKPDVASILPSCSAYDKKSKIRNSLNPPLELGIKSRLLSPSAVLFPPLPR